MNPSTEIAAVCFGSPENRISPDGCLLELALPILAGNDHFDLPTPSEECLVHGDWRIWKSDSVINAYCIRPVGRDLTSTTRRLYREAFEIAGDQHLYRFWNFVPGINNTTNGLENYRLFGMGRHEAFFEHYGSDASVRMPAATGVGTDDNSLVVYMLAGTNEPEHFENPNQVPAYRYPDLYGPCPPSFSRGTVVSIFGRQFSFVAGTASVRGHASVGSGDLDHQVEVTLSNLESLGVRMGFGPALGRGTGIRRTFRIYLRKPNDLERAQNLLSDGLFESGDSLIWLRSDLCRSDLDFEIEASLESGG